MEDLSHWDLAVDFTAEQAAALAMGIDPSKSGYVRSLSQPLYERMERSYTAQKLWHSKGDGEGEPFNWVDLGVPNADQMLSSDQMTEILANFDIDDGQFFLEWLRNENKSDFEVQRFNRGELARWLLSVGFKSKYLFQGNITELTDSVGKPLGTKERGSLLKMVIAMAIGGYGYVPTNAKSPIPKQIVDEIEDLGMKIDPDTVRKYLKEATDTVLPKKPHQL